MFIIKISFYAAAFILITVAAIIFYISIRMLIYFNSRKCKYCGSVMDYKGLKNDNCDPHYLFHCPKCKAWEQVPVTEIDSKI